MEKKRSPVFRVLFVCLGNICRSPAGEGVFLSMLGEAGWGERVQVDSAGTLGYHQGQAPDSRMRQAAAKRGYQITSRARQILPSDLEAFDLILTMDEDNFHQVTAMAENVEQRSRVVPFCRYCRDHEISAVPDPYYGGKDGFETVLDLLEDGCRGLLEEVESRLT